MALWSGQPTDGSSRLLEFCLAYTPARASLVLSSPLPMSVLPTAFLQDRMRVLLNALVSDTASSPRLDLPLHPTSPPILRSASTGPYPRPRSGFPSIRSVMGPARMVDAFLLHHQHEAPSPALGYSPVPSFQPEQSTSASTGENDQPLASDSRAGLHINLSPSSLGPRRCTRRTASPGIAHRRFDFDSSHKTTKRLLHARTLFVPPAVSLSEGFTARLASPNDDQAVSEARNSRSKLLCQLR